MTGFAIPIANSGTFTQPVGEIESAASLLTPAAIILNGAVMASHSHIGVGKCVGGIFKVCWEELPCSLPPLSSIR